MKILFRILVFIQCSLLYAQIGINTENPQGIVHVKPISPSTGDFIIDSDGNMGIGTLAPSAKLDINDGILRIRDQAFKGFALTLKQNISGAKIATWAPPGDATYIVDPAHLPGTSVLPGHQTTVYYPTNSYFTIPPGKSLIRASLFSKISFLPTSNKTNFLAHIRYGLWDQNIILPSSDYIKSPVGKPFEFLNITSPGLITHASIGGGTVIGGVGYWLVNNKSANDLKLYILVNIYNNLLNEVTFTDVASGAWDETIIIVTPIAG